ncbi:hypothetical protein HPB51_011767 [Rhipicephalus microplus]|uniref:Uncharacterized protein n=1 Tax=Rhipicephalus microplus TaxID=6941 RepID=A0A9J6DMQ5_RHIMP|nr:hypothetical protein HPB51_011767 [Rhipicephalus microplus]
MAEDADQVDASAAASADCPPPPAQGDGELPPSSSATANHDCSSALSGHVKLLRPVMVQASVVPESPPSSPNVDDDAPPLQIDEDAPTPPSPTSPHSPSPPSDLVLTGRRDVVSRGGNVWRDLNAQVITNDDGNSGTQRKESRRSGEPPSDAEEARIREYLCRSDTAVIYPEPVEAASAPAVAAQQQAPPRGFQAPINAASPVIPPGREDSCLAHR